MIYVSEEEAKQKKKELNDSLEFADDYDNQELTTGINWLDTKNTYEALKSESKRRMGSKRWFFLSHSRDVIKGKPQLIHSTLQTIPLIRRIVREKNSGDLITIYKFIDDTYDKRYDGQFEASYSDDFWVYRIIGEDSKEYYVLSKYELPNSNCLFNGMKIHLEDVSEFSKSMKIKSISSIFILKDFKPSVKVLTPKAIVTYTKERNITEKYWLDFLAYHPKFNSYNRFPGDIEVLKSAHLLSSKVDDYPLHLGIIGPQGTRKSKGYIETVAYKFDDNPHIVEGANSRIKGLSPSFKEKPANLGYLVKCDRIGWVDEIGKMVEFELNKHHTNQGNVLGELNSLLDHSSREVVSGNDNSVKAQATAKFCFVLNPINSKNKIGSHVGAIDPTTMSRIFWWVQDDDEQIFVKGKLGVIRIPPTPTQALNPNLTLNMLKKQVDLKGCWGRIENRDEFLTLFDTCQSFLSIINDAKVFELSNMITQLAREPMKGVWEPRSEHHVKLLIDGIVKHRCLFKDYDDQFTAKQDDYDLAERILIRMVKGWDTHLGIKKEYGGGQ